MTFNYLTTLRRVAEIDPGRPMLASPARKLNAAELIREVDRVAGWLSGHGVKRGDPVAIMLWNRPEFVIGFYAALALGAPPVNVNPRYRGSEIVALIRDCGARGLLHDGGLAVEDRSGLRNLGIALLDVDAMWSEVLRGSDAPGREPHQDDILINYTGGTTGSPKGVVWNIDEHYRMLWEILRPGSDPPSPDDVAAGRRRAPTVLPLSPLAHATAQGLVLNALNGGGTAVLTGSQKFDPAASLDLIEEEEVAVLGIVGDAFARPILAELDARPRSLKSLRVISSSGAIWSETARARLKEHLPDVRLIDNYGATEALITRNSGDGQNFEARPGVVVLGSDMKPLPPGTGEVGLVATSGRLPVGYLNDPVKTAATFPVIDGVRYLVVGDHATLEADGTIRMLGRGNACINSGGEKIWPEEIETVLLTHPSVRDVAVVAEPSERWGHQVVAVVVLEGTEPVSDLELAEYVRGRLAGYKVPKRFVRSGSVPRTFAGKLDYSGLRQIIGEPAGASS